MDKQLTPVQPKALMPRNDADHRRAAVEQAISKVSEPRTIQGEDAASLVVQVLADKQGMKPFEFSKLMMKLTPEQRKEMMNIAAGSSRVADMGRPGEPYLKAMGEKLNIGPRLLQRIHDAFDTDQIAFGLQERRGTDADTPLPPMTRRDQIEAALMANSK